MEAKCAKDLSSWCIEPSGCAGVETVQTIKRISEEQRKLFMYAFGVGCGVGR